MSGARCSDHEFISIWKELQSPTAVAKALGTSTRAVGSRRNRLEKKYGVILPVFSATHPQRNTTIREPGAAAEYRISDGVIVVGSDAHIWQRPWSTMQRAFIKITKLMKPSAVVVNGDMCDFARISRFPSIGWEKRPTIKEELEAVQDFLGEVTKAAGSARRFWPLGNHDMRFESRIAAAADEFAGIQGVHLKDHFPDWIPCWRVDVNDDVIIRHREAGGEHADWNNVLKSGKTIVTGHDHRCNVTPYTDYRGTRWGVRCGMMAESSQDPQFVNYLEARSPNWQPAMVVLTFVAGRLLWPELCVKHDEGTVQWRGGLLTV